MGFGLFLWVLVVGACTGSFTAPTRRSEAFPSASAASLRTVHAADATPKASGAPASSPVGTGATEPVSLERRKPSREELLADLVWAREKYAALKRVRGDSLAQELIKWFDDRDAIPVWVFDDQRRCAKDDLALVPPHLEPEGQRPPREQWIVVLRDCVPLDPDDSGRARRECRHQLVGHEWSQSRGGIVETLIDGRYVNTGGYVFTDGRPSLGVLSKLDARSAIFAGTPLWIHVDCDERLLTCDNGGTRLCRTCDPPTVWTIRRYVMGGRYVHRRPRIRGEPVCPDACPPLVRSADEPRLEALNALPLWEPFEDNGEPAAIYRQPGLCWKQTAKYRKLPTMIGHD
jgi:hypothetical protein